jgi:hypothetical protein
MPQISDGNEGLGQDKAPSSELLRSVESLDVDHGTRGDMYLARAGA